MRSTDQTPIHGLAEKDPETSGKRRLMVLGGASMLSLLAGSRVSWAQAAYPSRPIKLIVPTPAGSPVDAIARKIAEIMSPGLGVPIVVDNKPGAALTIGAAEVARSAPDGYTLLVSVAEPLVAGPAVIKVPYNAQRDFKMISKIAASVSGAVLIASTAKVKANNLGELIAEAKAASAPFAYASYGPASYPQQIMETLARQAGVKFIEVPYKGSPPALQDVVAGQVGLGFTSLDQATPFIANGKVKAIAIMGKAPSMPQLQTFADSGFNSLVFRNVPWVGLIGPAAMPESAVQKLADAVKLATNDAAFKKYLDGIGFAGIGNTPAQFQDEVRAEMTVIQALIKELGVVPE